MTARSTGMSGPRSGGSIRLRGVRQNNLAGFDLDIPLRRLTVVTGVSGSGKSSLAFDTLFAEGQRRYIETFSPYARQFFDRMDKPRVDRIVGIPPAIAIEQRNTVRSNRSTVGTMTEICDYMKVLWTHFSRPRCSGCEGIIAAEGPLDVWKFLSGRFGERIHITFPSRLDPGLGPRECLELIRSQGFRRCLVADRVRDLDALLSRRALPEGLESVEVIQDRIKVGPRSRARVLEACESAFSFGRGHLGIHLAAEGSERVLPLRVFSRRLSCPDCGIEVERPSPSLFSFNSPLGACPDCRGLGQAEGVDLRKVIQEPWRSLRQGAVAPWERGHGTRSKKDLLEAARKAGIPVDIPYKFLGKEEQHWVLHGRGEWYGVKGYFEWLQKQRYRVELMATFQPFRTLVTCPSCSGSRFRPEAFLHRIDADGNTPLHLPGFYALTLEQSLALVKEWRRGIGTRRRDSLHYALDEVRNRLDYLCRAGLSYLTLDRPSRTLSGGETERIHLASCLGTGLVNTLFILDEPSVGLHAVDTRRLIGILHRLRDAGNTVVVVEHDEDIIRAADHVVDIGPGSGRNGGSLVFAGSVKALLRRTRSTTARFLDRRDGLDPGLPGREVGDETPRLCIRKATCHNLKDLSLDIPLGCLVGLTGVSGSGKTTLVKEILSPRLLHLDPDDTSKEEPPGQARLHCEPAGPLPSSVLVDQSPIGRSFRSTPALYSGIFDRLRSLLAASTEAREAGFGPGGFSFNSPQGQCEECRGAGFRRVEMQFLSDVQVRCPQCGGRRYHRRIRELAVDFEPFLDPGAAPPDRTRWTVVDLLEATVDEVDALMEKLQHPHARHVHTGLDLLRRVGLGYLQLGQSLDTLSGGECQRLKVVRHLASLRNSKRRKMLFLFDEPTTGLHFADIRVLLRMFRSLVEEGHGVLVIEHHLEFVRRTDWVIDLGPGAGAAGGRVVAEGPPARLSPCPESVTGRLLHPSDG